MYTVAAGHCPLPYPLGHNTIRIRRGPEASKTLRCHCFSATVACPPSPGPWRPLRTAQQSDHVASWGHPRVTTALAPRRRPANLTTD